MSSSCFVKRVVPFALAFLCGVAAWQLVDVKLRVLRDVLYLEHGWAVPPAGRGGSWAAARREDEGSRTWLVIRSTAARVSKAGAEECAGCSVRMRVLFGEDGAVPGNGFSLSPSSYPLIEQATAAARNIKFTPATRNGRPVPVWANVTYRCAATDAPHATGPGPVVCDLSVDKDSARTWDGRPWRVVTTHE